jgi:hypothetical protein
MDDLEQCDGSKDKRSKNQLNINVYKKSCKKPMLCVQGVANASEKVDQAD